MDLRKSGSYREGLRKFYSHSFFGRWDFLQLIIATNILDLLTFSYFLMPPPTPSVAVLLKPLPTSLSSSISAVPILPAPLKLPIVPKPLSVYSSSSVPAALISASSPKLTPAYSSSSTLTISVLLSLPKPTPAYSSLSTCVAPASPLIYSSSSVFVALALAPALALLPSL